jgi:predicted phage baseplate assembly protein
MRIGGGAAGNLPPNSLSGLSGVDLTSKPVTGLQVIQPMSLQGGVDSETLASAEQRIPALLRNRDRAVTTQDYQNLASTVPGAAVGRVEVLPLFHPQNFEANVPGVVSVMIWPERETVGLPNPRADRALLETVFAYLEPRKPLATELYVIGCAYVGIGLSIGIAVRNGFGPDTVAAQVKAAVQNALWPLPPGGYTQTGYPLGRPIRTLELEVVIANVPGVDEVTGINLFRKLASGAYVQVTSRNSSDPRPAWALQSWELPELLQCVVATGGEGETVPAATTLDPAITTDGQDGIAIPVVPEVC